MPSTITRAAIDLTPILPGGENGGAKVFVLELIRELAEQHPNTVWLLLIHARAYAELVSIERANIKLTIAIGEDQTPIGDSLWIRIGRRVIRILPIRLKSLLQRIRHRISRRLLKGRPSKYQGRSSFLQRLHVDVLFCPFTAPNFWDPGIPTVATIHDLQYKTYPHFFDPNDVEHRDRIFWEAARNATLLTAVSDYARDSAIHHGRLNADQIRTIHHRMAHRVSSPKVAPHHVLKRFQLEPSRFLIYPANFWRHKNHEMLLTAFGMTTVNELPHDIKLVLTGSATERQKYLATAVARMGLKDRVVFPGYVSDEELGTLLNASLAMIFPSLYEGFGMPVIEAMAMGVPVASSRSASLAEVAGDAALLFDARKPREIAQAIQRLVNQPELRSALIEKGKIRAAAFSDTAQMAREYWAILKDAVESHSSNNRITGPYHDGWLGASLAIQVGHRLSPSTLELSLSSPDWIPYKRNRLDIDINGRIFESVRLARGQSKTIKLPIPAAQSIVEVFIAPTFDASLFNQGEDARPLTLKLNACRLIHQDDSIQALYQPENP